MNRKIFITCVLAVVFLPMMFTPNREETTWQIYLLGCLVPLLCVCTFCLNYYKFVPDALERKGKRSLWLYNLILILVAFFIFVGRHTVEDQMLQKSRDKMEMPTMMPQVVQGESHADVDADDKLMRPEIASETVVRQFRPGPVRGKSKLYMGAFFDVINVIVAIFIAASMRSNQRINALLVQQQEAETAQKEAELRALRNQISPHFLLTTLTKLYALAAISTEKAQDAIMQLSKMLRHMLYDNQSEMVTLASDADFIRSYIDLMRLRVSGNVSINTRISVADDSRTMVAPLLFISLVENAFKHGVSATEQCHINISLWEDAESIVCDIRNSNHPKLSADRSGHGIGLYNVEQRLDMIYSGKYEWTKGISDDGEYQSVIKIKKG